MPSVSPTRGRERPDVVIVRIYASVSPAPSERFAADLSATSRAAADVPGACIRSTTVGFRRAVLERWSLGVFYRANADASIIDRRDRLISAAIPTAIRRRLGLHEGASEFVAGPTMALPSGISFGSDHKVHLPDRFNVAVPFIDRHVAEGRGAKVAIRTVHGETVTYAELAERVNRAGNALLALGLKPGDRLLMVVKDCPAFFYLFWGAIKAGIVPVPPNTLLRAADYAYMFEDFGLRARRLFDRVRGRDRAGAEAGAGRGADGRRLPRRDGEGLADARGAASRRRPTIASGSTPPARPAGPRARSMPIATWW